MNVSDGGSGGKPGQDFDLNLAPIIDCFTVLITFLLASASYLAVGILDTNLAVEGAAGAATDKKPPAIRLDIVLNPRKEISLKVTGKGKLDKTIPPEGEDWNKDALMAEIRQIQAKWPDTKSAVLSAEDDVEYSNIVKIMDTVRTKLPSILLGGL